MPAIEHIFVLLLENRSFDHMLGFAGIRGTDASTGGTTVIDGLSGHESNTVDGVTYSVVRGADYAMPADPGHEFPDVLDQLTSARKNTTQYPPINNGGFAHSYAVSTKSANVAEIMKCFDTPRQLPVLYALAQEFAICDR